MKSTELLRHLEKKMNAGRKAKLSEIELSAALGIRLQTLSHWRKDTTVLTALQAANVITNAQRTAKHHVHSHAVKAIVEFFPIDPVAAGRLETKFEVFSTGQDAGKHLLGLKDILCGTKSGLYIFYDTRGKALYAGQTKKQNIWKEMNLAFNRERSAQVMTLVRHPWTDVNFKPAHIQVRQPKDQQLKLHVLAAYFSAYEVIPEMVDDLEALLIRAFPNDLLNYKMEKFGKAARKAAKTKALNAAAKLAR